jgi:hypothetical protein
MTEDALRDHRAEGAPFVRFAFCKRESLLQEAVARLKELVSDWDARCHGRHASLQPTG